MIVRSEIGKPCLVQGFLLCCGVLLFAACNTDPSTRTEQFTLQGNAQGSTFTIKYLDTLNRNFSGPVDSIFRVIDRSLSLWDSTSTVSSFNASPDTFRTTDPHFRVVHSLALGIWRTTDQAFDPTVLPLVRAWGLGKSGRSELDTTSIHELRPHVGMDRIKFTEVFRSKPGAPMTYLKRSGHVQFDPNGIAQGYTVDVIALYLQQQGITQYMVEVGGEARCSGLNESGTAWIMQIDKPIAGPEHVQQTVVPLRDRALATSGNYRKFIEVDGRRYGHTIDPRTGRPAMNALLSASVIADDCATADALGTALMVMGPNESKAWLARHPEVEAYLITDDGSGGYAVWNTPAWPSPR